MVHRIKQALFLVLMLVSVSTQAKVTELQPKIYGPTKTSDTLWNIALANKPKDVSVYQMMTAIHDANPDAFNNGNIHTLKPKQKLKIPNATVARKVNRKQAYDTIEKINIKKVDVTKKAEVTKKSAPINKAEIPSPIVVVVDSNQRAKELNAMAAESAEAEPKIHDLDSLLEKTIEIGHKPQDSKQKKPNSAPLTPEADALQKNLLKSQQALKSLEKEDASLAKQLGDLDGEMSVMLATLQQTETGASFQ